MKAKAREDQRCEHPGCSAPATHKTLRGMDDYGRVHFTCWCEAHAPYGAAKLMCIDDKLRIELDYRNEEVCALEAEVERLRGILQILLDAADPFLASANPDEPEPADEMPFHQYTTYADCKRLTAAWKDAAEAAGGGSDAHNGK